MVDLSYQLLAGISLFLVFMSPIVAGYVYGCIEEHTNLLDDTESIS